MVDFAALLKKRLDSMSPEERADYDARQAVESAAAATERTIDGHFERLGTRPKPGQGSILSGLGKRVETERFVEKEWIAPLRMRIETVGEGDESREVVRFLGAVTGHESFALDDHFVQVLLDPADREVRPTFYICAGTPGRYDACWVSIDDVVDYLRDTRPEILPMASHPAP